MYCIYPASGPWLEHPLVEQVTSNNIETKQNNEKTTKEWQGASSPRLTRCHSCSRRLISHPTGQLGSSFDELVEARPIRDERQGTRKQARKPQKERRGMTYRAGDARAHALVGSPTASPHGSHASSSHTRHTPRPAPEREHSSGKESRRRRGREVWQGGNVCIHSFIFLTKTERS